MPPQGKEHIEMPKAPVSRESFREGLRIFRYLKPYRAAFMGGLAFIVLSSLSTMTFPYLLKKLIDSAQASETSAAGPDAIALWMIAVLALQMIFSYMRIYLFTSVGEQAVADLRQDVYQRMIRMPMDFFAQRRVGELSSRISADVSQIQDAVTTFLAELLRGILTLIIGLSLIFLISWKLTIMMLAVVPVIILIAIPFSKRIRILSRQTQDQLGHSGSIVQETLQGIAVVKAFANEWYETQRYRGSISSVVQLAVRNGRFRGLFVSFLLFSVFGAIVLVVWYGAGLMQQGLLSFGAMTAFVIYTAFVGGTLAGFADLYSQLQKTLGATQRVRELLDEPVEALPLAQEAVSPEHRLQGAVSLSNVSFFYPSRPEVSVLQNVTIEAHAGEQIALVGPSGAGKSTLAALLLRFYEPQSGDICFDGRAAAEIPLSQLRRQMALVPQDVLLFGGTIFENIAYGMPEATAEAVEAAARQANAHQFIESFPEGYQTVVGERGVKLSGGQRQRIAIARAVLKDPVILILDEATSALDSESEALVQEALGRLMRDRTSFVIAHRLSTVRHADRIVVLEHGRVRETGTHESLMADADSLYHSLTRLQLVV